MPHIRAAVKPDASIPGSHTWSPSQPVIPGRHATSGGDIATAMIPARRTRATPPPAIPAPPSFPRKRESSYRHTARRHHRRQPARPYSPAIPTARPGPPSFPRKRDPPAAIPPNHTRLPDAKHPSYPAPIPPVILRRHNCPSYPPSQPTAAKPGYHNCPPFLACTSFPRKRESRCRISGRGQTRCRDARPVKPAAANPVRRHNYPPP